jgi:hypothetical protein
MSGYTGFKVWKKEGTMYGESLDPEMTRQLLENFLMPMCWFLIALVSAISVVFGVTMLGEWARLLRGERSGERRVSEGADVAVSSLDQSLSGAEQSLSDPAVFRTPPNRRFSRGRFHASSS